MEQVLAWVESYGVAGLFVIAFVESFFSPILPDVMLIPMALADPDQAIYYSAVVTVGAVLGGYVGYAIGFWLGIPILKRFVPPKYVNQIRSWLDRYGGWAIWLAAMAPIPYKFVSITAGVFKINLWVFSIASLLGRAKRFMIEGVLIYFYGEEAVSLIVRFTEDFVYAFIAVVVLAIGFCGWRLVKRRSYKQDSSDNEGSAE